VCAYMSGCSAMPMPRCAAVCCIRRRRFRSAIFSRNHISLLSQKSNALMLLPRSDFIERTISEAIWVKSELQTKKNALTSPHFCVYSPMHPFSTESQAHASLKLSSMPVVSCSELYMQMKAFPKQMWVFGTRREPPKNALIVFSAEVRPACSKIHEDLPASTNHYVPSPPQDLYEYIIISMTFPNSFTVSIG